MSGDLEEKFKKAHLDDEDLEELVGIADDLSISSTLRLLLDSELTSEEKTTYYKLKKGLNGSFTLGIEPRGSTRVDLHPKQLAHSLILGKTQYGKSTLLALLASQFLENDIPYWAFEPKQDQRHLIKDYPDLKVIRLDEIQINPFNPPLPSIPVRRWWQVIWEALTQEQDLLSGSKSMGYELFEKLLDQFGLTENPRSQQLEAKNIPTVRDFADLVDEVLETEEQRGGPRRRYLERLKTRIRSLLFSFKKTLDCREGWPMEKLAKEPIVFEYESIDQSAARFLILTLLYKLFYYYRGKGQRTEDSFHYLVFDEGEKVFSPYLEGKATGNPFLNEVVNWSKEFGLGFILANQTPKLTSSIKDNATTRIVFNLDGEHTKEVSSQMGLDSDQEQGLMELDVGKAVMRTSGSFTKPFLVNVPHFELEKDITDGQVRRHSEAFISSLNEDVLRLEKEEETEEPEEKKEHEDELELKLQTLLVNTAEFPFLSLTERQEKIGWGSNKLNKAIDELRNRGYMRKKRLNKGGRGGSVAFLELTNKAINYLKERGIQPEQSRGRGGITHTYWVVQLVKYYKERGYDVREEVKLEDVIADLVIADKEGKLTAVEVEVTKPKDTLAKLENLVRQVDEVLIIADKRAILNELDEKLADKDLPVKIKKAQDMDL